MQLYPKSNNFLQCRITFALHLPSIHIAFSLHNNGFDYFQLDCCVYIRVVIFRSKLVMFMRQLYQFTPNFPLIIILLTRYLNFSDTKNLMWNALVLFGSWRRNRPIPRSSWNMKYSWIRYYFLHLRFCWMMKATQAYRTFQRYFESRMNKSWEKL